MSIPRRSAGDKKVLSMLFSSAVKQKSGYLRFLRQQVKVNVTVVFTTLVFGKVL